MRAKCVGWRQRRRFVGFVEQERGETSSSAFKICPGKKVHVLISGFSDRKNKVYGATCEHVSFAGDLVEIKGIVCLGFRRLLKPNYLLKEP